MIIIKQKYFFHVYYLLYYSTCYYTNKTTFYDANKTTCYLRCDDYWLRCGKPEEIVTHAIFECPPILQAWSLSTTPSNQYIFSITSIYANMGYFFLRKNSIEEPKLDRNLIPG